MDSRGIFEIPNGDDEPIRWPRTTGEDVVAIATAIDPYIRAQSLRFGGHGVARQWRACVDDVAWLATREEYAENRAFWHALPAMCVYLHSQRSPMPPSPIWDALVTQLMRPSQQRILRV